MIEYYEQLSEEEQDEIRHVIQTLYRQTFLLERKFENGPAGWFRFENIVYAANIKNFWNRILRFAGNQPAGESAYGSDIYPGRDTLGRKLSRLATIYILVLKLIYDEQMAAVSSSSHIVTTLGAVNGKAGEFHVLNSLPSPTEMRRTIAFLKKIPDCRAGGRDGRTG